LHVYVNLLRATTKQARPKDKSRRQNYDHKDHEHRDNSGAAATTSIVSHKTTPSGLWGTLKISRGSHRLLPQAPKGVKPKQQTAPKKQKETRLAVLSPSG
jgi:hypothetical protein